MRCTVYKKLKNLRHSHLGEYFHEGAQVVVQQSPQRGFVFFNSGPLEPAPSLSLWLLQLPWLLSLLLLL